MFKKYLFCMQYFVEYKIDISFYFHNFFYFGFKLWPPKFESWFRPDELLFIHRKKRENVYLNKENLNR